MFAATSTFRRHAGIAAFELQLPEDLTTLSDEELNDLLSRTTEEFDGIIDDVGEGTPSTEQIAQMETLRDQILAVRGESERRTEEATARADQVSALRDAVHPSTDTETPAEGDQAPEAPAADAEQPEQVAAAGQPTGRPSLAAARTAQPATPTGREGEQAPDRPRMTLVASAGVPNFTTGQEISRLDAATIFGDRVRPLRGTEGRQAFHVATARIPYPEDLVASGMDADEVLARAADESRLPGGSLVAAGTGWCAPSEILYDVPGDGASEEGVFSLPEISVARGGIKFTKGVDFATVYGDDFNQTEADNIAGTAKTFVSVPCPNFDNEERLDATGIGVKSGILQRIGFPETIAQFMQEVMVAHAHKVGARKLAKVSTHCTDVGVVGSAEAFSTSILEAVELQVIDYRLRNMLPDSATIEVVLPWWVKGPIRADYAKRNGVDNPLEVTDAQILNWFAIRNAAPQFTKDWQTKLEGGVAIGDVAAAATAYPAHAQFLLYKAGTFVGGMQDVITINGLYDSALLAQNEELALFTEQGYLVAFRGFHARKASVAIKLDGQSGVQAAYTAGV